jgi:ankyrin repeat protein
LKCKELNINDTDKYGRTALITCVFSNNIPALKVLLKNKKILVNKQDKNGNTALMHAVKHESINIIKELLKDERIDVNIKNLEGKTALQLTNDDKIKNLLLNFTIIKSKKMVPFDVKSHIDKFF